MIRWEWGGFFLFTLCLFFTFLTAANCVYSTFSVSPVEMKKSACFFGDMLECCNVMWFCA